MSKKELQKRSLICPSCLSHIEKPLLETSCPSCGKNAADLLVKNNENDIEFYIPELLLIGKKDCEFPSEYLQTESLLLADTPELAFSQLWLDIYLSSGTMIINEPEKAVTLAIEKTAGLSETTVSDYLKELYSRIRGLRCLYRERDIKETCAFTKESFEIIEENENSVSIRGCIKLWPTKGAVDSIKNYYEFWLVYGMCAVSLDITMTFIKVGEKWAPADLMPQIELPRPLVENVVQAQEFIKKQIDHTDKLHQKEINRKKNIKRTITISCITFAILTLMFVPYIITRNEGFPKLLAQIPMFITLIFSYITVGMCVLFAALAMFGSFGRAVTGNDEPFNATFGIHIGIAIVTGLLYYAFSGLLISLDYVNPFTGELFTRLIF